MHHTKLFEKVNQSTLKFLEPLTPGETYRTIVKEAIELVGANYGAIFLQEGKLLRRVYASASFLDQIIPPKEGFTYKSLRTSKPYLIDIKDVEKVQPLAYMFRERSISSFIVVPISYQNQATGVLTIYSTKKSNLSQEDLPVLAIFGSLASLAIKKTQLYTEAKKALEDRNKSLALENTLERINKAGLKFLEPLTPEETFAHIVQEAIKLINAKYGSIILMQQGKLERVYSSSPLAYLSKPRKRSNTYIAFKKREILLVDAVKVEKAHPEIKKIGLKSVLFIPLSYRDQSIGVLILNSEKEITKLAIELKILKLFGFMASLAIRKAQLQTETQKALETRNLFISMAAHEFRTPLTTINGYAQLLQSKLSEQDTVEAKWSNELLWETNRLNTLMNELLTIDRIKSGQLQFFLKKSSFIEVLKRAIIDFGFLHPNHKIIFNNHLKEGEDIIVGDSAKLLQVVSNLLDNAAKFSSPEKEICINLKSKGLDLILNIKDQGRGIIKEELPKIFEGFYRGKNHSVEGMGLGLFLAKNIIERHRGSIHAHSKVDKGTLFEIKLPRLKK